MAAEMISRSQLQRYCIESESSGQDMRTSPVALLLLLLILQPVFLPIAAASWEEDGWLETIGAEERLMAGDEFACYGIPDLSWQADPGAVATECRAYIMERIPASIWGEQPLSARTPAGLTYHEHSIVDNIGFPVHGDLTGLDDTAWHSIDDEPEQPEDWYNLGRRGGSLEKKMNTVSEVEAEASKGGLLNFYWIGKIGENTIRHDSEVEAWLLDSDAWFTTWGVAWSTWVIQRCHQFEHDTLSTDAGGKWLFEISRPTSCQSIEDRVWDVPVTWRINASQSMVSSVVYSDTGEALDELEVTENQLKTGWRMDDSHLLLTVPVGVRIEITFEDADVEVDILDEKWFNGRSFAVTIAAHSTEDLFTWSKRFDASSDLRFTWLLTPRDARESSVWLPIVGIVVILSSMLAFSLIIRKDRRFVGSMEEE